MDRFEESTKVWNMNVKGKGPRGRPRSTWEQQVRKDATQKEENCGEKMRRKSCGKTQTDGEAWLSLSHKVDMSEENGGGGGEVLLSF
jgi:hypothetical protein